MPQVKKAKKEINGTNLIISFANDKQLVVAFAELPDDIKTQLAMHGLSQKVGDSYASAETVEDAVSAATRVAEDLKAGNWSVRRAGEGSPRTTLLAEALARLAGRSIEEAMEVLNDLSEEDQKKLRQDPGVKKVMAEIKLERAAKAAEGSASVVASLFA